MKKKISKISIFFTNILLLVVGKVQAAIALNAVDPAYGIDFKEPVNKIEEKAGFLERFFDFSWIIVPICWIVGLVIYYKKQNKKMKAAIIFMNVVLCSIVTFIIYNVVR